MTVDIPDNVYRRIKTKAALCGECFNRYLVKALQRDLGTTDLTGKKRLKGPLFTEQKTLAATPEQFSQILEDDDHALLG